ncbi:MAG: DUF6515 family protein [Sphingobacteriales bacterium]
MKRFNAQAFRLFLTGMFLVAMTAAVNAQRGGHTGGVHAGGSHIGGGGRAGISNGLHRGNLGYFAGRGYHGGAFYRPGFGYYGYPHIGFYLHVLPFGYYPFYWDSYLYYYYGGVFYSPDDNGGYVVVAPPIGAAIPDLPDNAHPIKIDGVQYYEQDGVYYKEGVDDKGKKIYIVAGKDGLLETDKSATDPNATVASPRVGDIVNQLPDNCHKVTLNGKDYYVSPNDIYYEKVTDPNGSTGYRIVSLPDDGAGS